MPQKAEVGKGEMVLDGLCGYKLITLGGSEEGFK